MSQRTDPTSSADFDRRHSRRLADPAGVEARTLRHEPFGRPERAGGEAAAAGRLVRELHPLAVRADKRNQGIGRAIVTALEDEARKKGGLIIHLGADDEKYGGETSLANADLFDNLPEKLKNFRPGTHQSGFYLKLGYQIIGVMPDANGKGKPDIFFGKRL